MPEILAKKKRIRGGHRASATRMIQQVNDMIAASEGDPSIELDIKRLLQLRLSLEEKLTTLKQLDGDILELVEDDDGVADEIEQADDFKEKIYAATIDIDRVSISKRSPPTDSSASGSSTSRGGAPHSRSAQVRLPKLSIRPFSGDITDWTTFWDTFESAIDHNPGLSEIDKFSYLKSLLEKSAAEAVSGLTLTADNYKEAISILKKWFGSKQQIITKHMDILLKLEAVLSQHNLKGLRHLYDLVESQVRGLKSLGVEPSSYGSLLFSVLLQKLPPELRLVMSREIREDDWNLEALLKQLEVEIKARERAIPPSTQTMATKKTGRSDSTSTAATLLAPSNVPSCCYCHQSHPSGRCKSVADIGERKQILKRSGRCFICLKKYHISKECRSAARCQRCGGRHHVSICVRDSTGTDKSAVPSSVPPGSRENTSQSSLNPQASEYAPIMTSSMYTNINTGVLLQTARAQVYNPDRPQSPMGVRVILDSGSQRSYITNRTRDALSVCAERRQRMSIKTFGSEKEEERDCDVVKIAMKAVDGSVLELQLFTVPLICEPLTNQPIALCKEEYEHLTHLELADSCDEGELLIDILIGLDYYWLITTNRVVRGKEGPVAVYTKLGWVLSGPSGIPDRCSSSVNIITSHILRCDSQLQVEKELESTLKMFWELESLGINGNDSSILEEFDRKITFKDGRYQVSLPWKESHATLPENYHLSKKRLQSLLCRLKQNPAVLKEYDTTIKDQLSRGIVEVVSESENRPAGGVIHYIPHLAVIRQDKETSKLRIVYDASARADGPSLNDCLCTGPKFGQNIMDIILRFRVHSVALVADIEKAFLMISVSERDRDALRFLWVDDITKYEPEIITLRFTRVVFGVSSSPFLLNATIGHHLKKYSSVYPEAVEKVSRSMYVDDVASGADTEGHAYKLYADSKTMLREGGFNLRKFVTNSCALQKKIDEKERLMQSCTIDRTPSNEGEESYTKLTLGTAQKVHAGETKVLGVRWNPTTDSLVFDFSDVATQLVNLEPTKRHVIGVASRFYDPLGFVSPVIIRFKVLFQELCEAKLDWDGALPSELQKKWQSLVSSLQRAQPISIPRFYFQGLSMTASLCCLRGFCDASKTAYAAVIYLSVHLRDSHFTRFIACKTRVAPLKEQTIPRLELLSALLLSKLMESVSRALESELSLGQPSYFTDSMVALYWIKGQGKEWKPFIQNRVNQIHSLTSVDQWQHCAGAENPADIPSRGKDPCQLSECSLWLHGPDWLKDGRVSPNCDVPVTMPEECRLEQKKAKKSHSLLAPAGKAKPVEIGKLMKCEDFSSKTRLLRVTAQVMKCALIWKRKTGGHDPEYTLTITSQDIQEAETCWIREMQTSLEGSNPKFVAWQQQFGMFTDADGVWRCGGRLTNADIPFSTRHPVLLDPRHPFTALLIHDAHARVKHNGVRETLTELRSSYWIVRGRSVVRRVLRQCVICRRFEGKAHNAPPPPPLPSFRVREAPPFTYTGVDYAGPLYVKGPSHSGSTKVWICLYTCCVVRAIHLEVVPDMTTQSFIRSFKRFTARRGVPVRIVSDNGKTFKSAAKVLANVLKHPEVQGYLAGIRIQWSFNLEKSPWWGGIFERMVRSVKRCLRKTIGRGRLTLDELVTALTEVEVIVNSRPLSYFSTEDIEEPITPSHLMSGRRLMSLPDGPYNRDIDDNIQVDRDSLTKRMVHLNHVLEHFWKRWKSEYLLELRNSHRQSPHKDTHDHVSIGDMVLIHDEGRPRGFWRLARVEDLITGSDGKVRGAHLRTQSAGNRPTYLRRPVQLLYPLEVHSMVDANVHSSSDVGTDQRSNTPEAVEGNVQPPSRPKRAAAQNAREILRVLAEESRL